MSVLDQIVETKRRELEIERAALPIHELRRQADAAPPPRDFFAAWLWHSWQCLASSGSTRS